MRRRAPHEDITTAAGCSSQLRAIHQTDIKFGFCLDPLTTNFMQWKFYPCFWAHLICIYHKCSIDIGAKTTYEGVTKSFRTESINKYTLTTTNTRWESTQRVMTAKLIGLTHKIAIQVHLVAESYTICSSRFRRSVRILLDTPSYIAPVLDIRPLDNT
jgi:hypothetical protein